MLLRVPSKVLRELWLAANDTLKGITVIHKFNGPNGLLIVDLQRFWAEDVALVSWLSASVFCMMGFGAKLDGVYTRVLDGLGYALVHDVELLFERGHLDGDLAIVTW